LEADLVVAAGAGLLALVAAAGRLAQARADAATDAARRLPGADAGLDGVQFHVFALRVLRAPSPGTRPWRSFRARPACPRGSRCCWSCAGRARAPSPRATRASPPRCARAGR